VFGEEALAAITAATAAESAAAWAVCLRKYAHPISTTSPIRATMGINATVKSTTV
jgi:hypothetical protein